MKKVILILIFLSFSLLAQNIDYITAGDSISIRPNTMIAYRVLYFAVYDTAVAAVDTLVCESTLGESNIWDTMPVVDVEAMDTEIAGDIIPGNGAIKWYKITMEYPGRVRVRRTNVTSRTQRTAIEWRGGM
jgi:hypothetical protein